MRMLNGGDEVVLEVAELAILHRHLDRFEELVNLLRLLADSGRLQDDLAGLWTKLHTFLNAEELPGSEVVDIEDGRYCCQWRTRGLHSGQTECHQYNAWYIFAWSAGTAAAIARGADARLVAGE